MQRQEITPKISLEDVDFTKARSLTSANNITSTAQFQTLPIVSMQICKCK